MNGVRADCRRSERFARWLFGTTSVLSAAAAAPSCTCGGVYRFNRKRNSYDDTAVKNRYYIYMATSISTTARRNCPARRNIISRVCLRETDERRVSRASRFFFPHYFNVFIIFYPIFLFFLFCYFTL